MRCGGFFEASTFCVIENESIQHFFREATLVHTPREQVILAFNAIQISDTDSRTFCDSQNAHRLHFSFEHYRWLMSQKMWLLGTGMTREVKCQKNEA